VLREDKNIIAFEVAASANKIQIKQAVETQFSGVKVAEVRIANAHGKRRRQGMYMGRRPDWKKAYVRLSEGTIEFFEGV
jgi:large subunit ribosomal protein L23